MPVVSQRMRRDRAIQCKIPHTLEEVPPDLPISEFSIFPMQKNANNTPANMKLINLMRDEQKFFSQTKHRTNSAVICRSFICNNTLLGLESWNPQSENPLDIFAIYFISNFRMLFNNRLLWSNEKQTGIKMETSSPVKLF